MRFSPRHGLSLLPQERQIYPLLRISSVTSAMSVRSPLGEYAYLYVMYGNDNEFGLKRYSLVSHYSSIEKPETNDEMFSMGQPQSSP